MDILLFYAYILNKSPMIFPRTTKPYCIIICAHANGSSSYRDAINIYTITKSKWQCDGVILTDNINALKAANQGCNNGKEITFSVKHVTNCAELLTYITDYIKAYSSSNDILLTVSSHGFNSPGGDIYEHNHKNEYILINGQKVMDHDLTKAIFSHAAKTCLVLCLLDTCHSGTLVDLQWLSLNGEKFKPFADKSYDALGFSISACGDNELAGEDISKYGGWGGKLICMFVDYLVTLGKLDIIDFYDYVQVIFSSQSNQRSHPVLQCTRDFKR